MRLCRRNYLIFFSNRFGRKAREKKEDKSNLKVGYILQGWKSVSLIFFFVVGLFGILALTIQDLKKKKQNKIKVIINFIAKKSKNSLLFALI